MTASALISALLIGLAVGVLGRRVLPGRSAAPIWLTLSVGVGATLLGTITARIAGVDVAGASPLRLVVQTGFAAIAVVLAVAAAGRAAPIPDGPDVRRSGSPAVADRRPGDEPEPTRPDQEGAR